MTPLALRLALPAVQIIGALVISRRISWRQHPALIAYLASEGLWRLAELAGIPAWALPLQLAIQIGIRTAATFEVFAYARLAIPARLRGALVGLALSASAFLAGASSGTPAQRMLLFRQHYLAVLCIALVALVTWRLARPVLECARHRIYRLGLAAWIGVMACAGTFVRGGWGYKILPYSREMWQAVELLTYGALVTTIAVMTAAMVAALPRRRAVAAVAVQRRKVVEMVRAA